MKTEELVQQMRAAAEKATPGPWVQDGYSLSRVLRCTAERGSPEAKHICGDYTAVADAGENWRVDAPFIVAANPTNVLALIAALEAANARADAAEAKVGRIATVAADAVTAAYAGDDCHEALSEILAIARAALASEASS